MSTFEEFCRFDPIDFDGVMEEFGEDTDNGEEEEKPARGNVAYADPFVDDPLEEQPFEAQADEDEEPRQEQAVAEDGELALLVAQRLAKHHDAAPRRRRTTGM